MLQVRPQQFSQLESQQVAAFEDRSIVWLRDQFPQRAELLSEAGERDSVRAGIQSAHLRGFDSERNVVKYLYLRTLLGSDFDIRPGSASLLAMLTDLRLPQDARIDGAFDLLEKHLVGAGAAVPRKSGDSERG